MIVSNRFWSLAVLGMMLTIAVSTHLSAAQRGPSRTKMPPLSDEEKKSAKDNTKEPAKMSTRKTPFGETKAAAKPDDPPPPTASPFVEVEEKGDTIVFTRRTPFGKQTWQKKRSELTPGEEQILRAHQAKQSDGATGDETAPTESKSSTSR